MKKTRQIAIGFLVFFLFLNLFTESLDLLFGWEIAAVKVVDKILALTGLFLFLWGIKFSKEFFGVESKVADRGIVIMTYVFSLLFILQTMQFKAAEGATFLALPLHYLIILLSETRLFIAGGIILLFLAFYTAIHLPIKKPSFIAALGETGRAHGFSVLKRFLISFFVLLALYQLILKPTLEWLTLSTGSIFANILALYLLIDMGAHHKFNFKKLVVSLEDIIHNTYKKFIALFHSRKKFLFALSLLIAVIPAVDIGHFVLGFLTSKPNPFYAALIAQPGHTSWLFLMLGEIPTLMTNEAVLLVIGYVVNAMALITLLLMPVLLWARVFNKQTLELPRSLALCFTFNVTTALLAPAFKIMSLNDILFVGTDIQTVSLHSQPVGLALIIAAVLTTIVALMYNKHVRGISAAIIIASVAFFLRYVQLYYLSVWDYLTTSIEQAGNTVGILFWAVLLVSMFFSIGAVLVYLSELWTAWKE
jgi:hypothetical protein